MTSKIEVTRAEPMDCPLILKFMYKVRERNQSSLPPIIGRFALRWITDVVGFQSAFVAKIDGRLVGTIGLSATSYQWNPYVKFLDTQWLHVLDTHKDSDVRDRLIMAARDDARDNQADMDLAIPDYMHKDKDKTAPLLERRYFFRSDSIDNTQTPVQDPSSKTD